MLAILVTRTKNRKLGLGSCTTYAGQASCPDTCPFRAGGGCYAEAGPMYIISRRLRELGATAAVVARAEADAIDAVRSFERTPYLRLHTLGDCPDEACAMVVSAAVGRATKRGLRVAWTYTHAFASVPVDAWYPIHVRASVETLHDAEVARSMGYSRMAWVVPAGEPMPCNAFRCPGNGCTTCQRCWVSAKDVVFTPHGSGAKRAVTSIQRKKGASNV